MRMNRLVYSLLVIVIAATGCLAKGTHIPDQPGTISGAVSAPGLQNAVADREIVFTDATSGRRYTTHTNNVGDFTIQVPQGRYHVNLTMRPGETMANKIDDVGVTAGGVKADVNLVIATPK